MATPTSIKCQHSSPTVVRNSFKTACMYINGERLKDAVDSEITVLNHDFELLLVINSIAKEKATEIVKKSKAEIDKLNELSHTERDKIENKELEQKVYDDFITHAFHSRHLITHSLFVSAYSTFETGLFQVAFRLESYCTSEIKIKDISKERGEIDRYRKYINLVHKISSATSQNSNWKNILIFQKIRNLIVHNSSTFKEDNSKVALIKFLKNYDTHIVREHFFKIFDDNFLIDFKNAVIGFCDDIFKDIYRIKVES